MYSRLVDKFEINQHVEYLGKPQRSLCSKSEIALLTDMVKQTIRLISVSNVAPIRFVCFAVFLLRLFNFCLLYLFSATLRGGL